MAQANKLKKYVSKIESINAELATIHAEYMLDCKDKHADIRQILKDAKADGVTAKVVRAKVKQRDYLRKASNASNGLDADEAVLFDSFEDTPLAQAAAKNGGAEARI